MKQRKINGTLVGEIGLGCMGMSQSYGPSDDNESLRVLDRAVELGCNFWDTADVYGAGKNELLVGKALKKHRQSVFLATKVGNVYDRNLTTHQDQVQANAGWIVDGTPAYIHKCIDLSLQRLGVDVIDLYYLHRVDPQVPIEDTMGAMADLVREGKVRYLGLSEASADTIRRAVKVHTITALQSEYSLWTRHVEAEILPTCRELGIVFVPYSPLGRGFLTGTVTDIDQLSENDFRRRNPRFQGENFQENLKILPVIQRIADRQHATPAQVALAWVLKQGTDLIPIPGTKHLRYLEENLATAEITLTPADLGDLDRIRPHGERYPEVNRAYVQK
ncbi:MAG: aldo/keto reductase [Anaerolineales bacterium]|nr:aldo/keto reductase [Anaerolineae bacterium]PWB49811.1 MAG: aldo/keto reductase [Anaerolineales bacterium]